MRKKFLCYDKDNPPSNVKDGVLLSSESGGGGGAEEFICHIESDTYQTGSAYDMTSDKTFDEIKNAYDSGKKVRILYGNNELIFCGGGGTEFRYITFMFTYAMGMMSNVVSVSLITISQSGVSARSGSITLDN